MIREECATLAAWKPLNGGTPLSTGARKAVTLQGEGCQNSTRGTKLRTCAKC